MRYLRSALGVVVAGLTSLALAPQSRTGSVCVAPAPAQTHFSSPGYECESNDFFLRVDDRPRVAWSKKTSARIDHLDLETRHKIRIYCAGKPHQTVFFSFPEFKSATPCLFLNDLYLTAQLWERAPWCKCK